MFPPQQSNTSLNIEALSGIAGSISIACWVVVFSPQIIENLRRGSTEGLSVVFLLVWLLGDIFNVIGAVLQGVLPTMTILAIYYTLADIVLLIQVFYYRGFTLQDSASSTSSTEPQDGERQPLLNAHSPGTNHQRNSFSEEFRLHGQHLSPATPMLRQEALDSAKVKKQKPNAILQKTMFNFAAVVLVCAAGALGWYISSRYSRHHNRHSDDDDYDLSEPLEFDSLGQFFGYLCAFFYLASRVPQLLLNYRRKSTDGVSLLFFLFACIGNLTYDLSIFAYNPQNSCRHGPDHCRDGEAQAIYARYIAVNASWIVGSMGTLFLDGAIFVQFFIYQKDDDEVVLGGQNGRTVPEQAVSD